MASQEPLVADSTKGGDAFELPAVDMQAPDEETVPQLMEMMTNLGFLHLRNVPGFDEKRHLEICKAFHALPKEAKTKLLLKSHNPANSNIYRGLVPFLDNDASHKEFYDMGGDVDAMSENERKFPLYEKTPFPEDEPYKYILEGFQNHFNVMKSTGLKLLRLLALGLGKDGDFFLPFFENECLSTMRSIHYLPRGKTEMKSDQLNEDDYALCTPAHTDSGFVTLLTTFGYPGLQVLVDGEFKSIKPSPDCIVVNLGEVFQRITNFKLKATEHRVLDIGVERYSSPFFMDPKYSAVIPSNILNAEEEGVEPPIRYGPLLIRTMTAKFKEWEGFLEAAQIDPAHLEL